MRQVLLFWRTGPDVKLSTDAIGQELSFGEDVEGLIDLPIKEIIARIQADFPDAQENVGALNGRGEGGPFEVTWTWQFFRVEAAELTAGDRQKFIAIGKEFQCEPWETKSTFPLS